MPFHHLSVELGRLGEKVLDNVQRSHMPLVRPVGPTWAVVVTGFAPPDAILADTVEPAATNTGGIDLLARMPHHQSAHMDKVRIDEVEREALLVKQAASMLRELDQCGHLEDDTPCSRSIAKTLG